MFWRYERPPKFEESEPLSANPDQRGKNTAVIFKIDSYNADVISKTQWACNNNKPQMGSVVTS